MQLIWNLSIEGMMGAQSRSYPHGVPKVSTFTHRNKLTSRIVSKPPMGLTTLNQALIHTPTPNLMSVIWSESMISQAFQACYSIEGCLSDRCVLSHEKVGYKVENSTSHQDHPLHTQENRIYNLKSFWDEGKGQEGSLSQSPLWEIYYNLTNVRDSIKKK